MKSILRRCKICGIYTLKKDKCPRCGGPLEVPHPPKYSPDDKYQIYRIKMKVLSDKLNIKEEIKQEILKSERQPGV